MNHPVLAVALLLSCLAGLVLLLPQTGPLPVREAAWDEQVAAVRRGDSDSIHIRSHAVSEDQLDELRGLPRLRELKLERGDFSPQSLAVIGDLPRLETLWLLECRVGNEGLEHLAANQNLTRLNLPRGQFDDEGLRLLTSLPRLAQLRCSSPHVTGEGLKSLKDAPSLRFLHLIEVPLPDDALRTIFRLERLESLYLDRVQVNAPLLERLLARRPLHVHVDQLPVEPHPHAHPHPH